MKPGRPLKPVIAVLVAAATAVSLWIAPAAGAATVTLGPTGDFFPSLHSNNGDITVANVTLNEPGLNVSSPVNGTIVQWHVVTGGTGQYVLRVIRPAPGGLYAAVGSSPADVTTAGPNTFPANLPIQAGDLIGVDVPTNQGIALGTVAGSKYVGWGTPLTSTPTASDFDFSDFDVALSAQVQYPDPAPPANPGTKKKCKKKKHKRSASAAKKCKKKKK
jgi:hypothetical protein